MLFYRYLKIRIEYLFDINDLFNDRMHCADPGANIDIHLLEFNWGTGRCVDDYIIWHLMRQNLS